MDMTFEAPVTSIVVIVCTAGAIIALLRGRAALRGTTLIGAWWWAIAAAVALAAVALDGSGPLRFAAACLTLCPTVAVLGAKRPQDRAWHWVVLSLWIVLCIAAINAAFFHPSRGAVELHSAQTAFLVVLVLLGVA